MDLIKNSGKEADAADELDLIYGIVPERIYISEAAGKQEINSIKLNIGNTMQTQTAQVNFLNPDNLKPTDDLPSYGEPYDKYNLSWFFIWFPWGSEKGSFATSEAGENITVSPASDNYEWHIVKKSSKSIGTYWTLFPKKSTVMDPMDSIAFIINNIVSLTPDGMSWIYIENHKIPGFENHIREEIILKKNLTIRSFKFDPEKIAKGAKTTLKWETVGSISCVINPGDIDVPSSGQMELYPDEDKTYTLKASDETTKSCKANAKINIGNVKVDFFKADPECIIANGEKVTLKWKTSFASTCTIDQGIGQVEEEGSRVIYIKDPIKYTITCNGKNGPVEETAKIGTREFIVNEFTSKTTQENDGRGGIIYHYYIVWDIGNYLKSCKLIEISTGKIISYQQKGTKEINPKEVYQLVGQTCSDETITMELGPMI